MAKQTYRKPLVHAAFVPIALAEVEDGREVGDVVGAAEHLGHGLLEKGKDGGRVRGMEEELSMGVRDR